MASPDLTPYVDLTLFDIEAQDLVDIAVSDAQTKLPDWVPAEGNTEMVLIEALALEVMELVYSVNRVVGAVVEVLMQWYDIPRDLGSPPTTTLVFTVSDATGHEIPAGTSVRLAISEEGGDTIDFFTDSYMFIPEGSTVSDPIPATGNLNTDLANGTPAGTLLEMLDSIVYVESVSLASNVVGGKVEEDDQTWIARAVQRLARLSSVLVLPRHFQAAALENPNVVRAFAIDNYDPADDPDNNGPVGNDAGHITVAVYGDGAFVDAATKDDIDAVFDDEEGSNLTHHIIDPTITAVDVTVDIIAEAGYTTGTVQQNVINALTNYFSTATWDWSGLVRRNALISLIGGVDGVAYVDTLTVPAADLPLPGVAPLATAGVFTVTVT